MASRRCGCGHGAPAHAGDRGACGELLERETLQAGRRVYCECRAFDEKPSGARPAPQTPAKILDFTSGQSGTCEIHGGAMTKGEIPILYGYIETDGDYSKARLRAFPHAGESCWLGGCEVSSEERVRLWLCATCDGERAAYLETRAVSDPRV